MSSTKWSMGCIRQQQREQAANRQQECACLLPCTAQCPSLAAPYRWLQLSEYMRSLGYEGVAQTKAAAGGSDFMLALFYRPVSSLLSSLLCTQRF